MTEEEAREMDGSCLGKKVDRLARERGGWPAEAVVYAVEAINDTQALLTGATPIGRHKSDPRRPKFAPKKACAPTYQAVVSMDEWRALFSKQAPTAPSQERTET